MRCCARGGFTVGLAGGYILHSHSHRVSSLRRSLALDQLLGAESEPLPSSVLILNQTRAGLPWFAALCARKHCANSFTGLRRFKLHKGEGRAVRECGSAATSPPWPMLWAHRRA